MVPTKLMNIRFSIFYLDNTWGGTLDKSELPVYVYYQGMEFTYNHNETQVQVSSVLQWPTSCSNRQPASGIY